MKKKKCGVCNLTKPVSQFFLRKKKKFVVSKGIYKTYTFPMYSCKVCSRNQLRSLSSATKDDGSPNWSGVLANTREGAKKRGINYDLNLKDFKVWLSEQKNECHYCKISLEDYINKLFEEKYLSDAKPSLRQSSYVNSKRFSIDRKNNDHTIGYTINNICFACHFCNSKKSDKYSYGGFVNKNSIFHTCKCGQRLRLPKNKKISSFSCPICNTSYKKKPVINERI